MIWVMMMLIYQKNLRTLKQTKNIKNDITYWLEFEKDRRKFDNKIKRICRLQFEKEKKNTIRIMNELSDQGIPITLDKILSPFMTEDWRFILKKIYEIIGRFFFDRQIKELNKISETKQLGLQIFDEIHQLRTEVENTETDRGVNMSTISDIIANIVENPITTIDENNNFWFLALISYLTLYISENTNNIIGTTRNKLASALLISSVDKENATQIIARITNVYDSMIINRSNMIASTEVAKASNFGSRVGADSSKLPLKHTWISTMDTRVRDIHILAHGQTRPKDIPFDVGGERLKYPHDVSLGASSKNIVNCRCISRYSIDIKE